MKKIAFLVGVMFIALSVSAQSITSRSRIVLSSANQADATVSFLMSPSFSDDWDNTWDAVAANPGGIYLLVAGERYTIWASNAYSSNMALGFATGDNTSYTLKFQSFLGEEYTIKDRVADQIITVNASTPDYEFTIDEADKNKTINDRFVINYARTPDTGELEICHKDNQLQLLNNPYLENIVVKDADGNTVINVPSTNTPQNIDLTSLAAGQYTVELNGGNRSFIIKK